MVVGREQRLFAAHEDVLSRSPFFHAAFKGQFLEASTKQVVLPDELVFHVLGGHDRLADDIPENLRPCPVSSSSSTRATITPACCTISAETLGSSKAPRIHLKPVAVDPAKP